MNCHSSSQTILHVVRIVVVWVISGILVSCGGGDSRNSEDVPVVPDSVYPDVTLSNPGFVGNSAVRFGFGHGHDTASAMALQADGKVIVGGGTAYLVREFSGSYLFRLLPDGRLDVDFGEQGRVHVALDSVIKVKVDKVGMIYAAGYVGNSKDGTLALAAMRLFPNGAIDRRFGADGLGTISDFSGGYFNLTAALIQSDGKVLFVGQGQLSGVTGFVVARLGADGMIDAGFANGGMIAVAIGDTAVAHDVAVDASGRIVVVGDAAYPLDRHIAVLRLTGNGQPDKTFGEDRSGIQMLLAGYVGSPEGVMIDSADRIVVVGWIEYSKLAVIQLNDAGGLDSKSSDGGWTILSKDGGVSITESVGKNVVMIGVPGVTLLPPAVVEVSSDGSLAPILGVDARMIPKKWVARVSAIGFDTVGRIVAVGSDGLDEDFAVWRVLANGEPDTSFGAGGQVLLDSGDEQAQARDLYQANDGKLFVAGFMAESGRYAIAKLNRDGTFDTSFGNSGRLSFSHGSANAMTVLRDGKIVLVGQTSSYGRSGFGVIRLDSIGNVDSSFGFGGYAGVAVLGYDRAKAVVADLDGGIVIAGSAQSYSSLCGCNDRVAVLRLGPNGARDTSFASTGTLLLPADFTAADMSSNSMTIDSYGRIVIIAKHTGGIGVVRLNSDGSFDSSFGNGGMLVVDIGSGSETAKALTLDSLGGVLVAGESGESALGYYVVRLSVEGFVDKSFGVAGVGRFSYPGAPGTSDAVNAIIVDGAGDIYLTGSHNGDFALVRMKQGGIFDSTFGNDGVVRATVGSGDGAAYSIVVQDDGAIIMAGNGGLKFGVVRIPVN